jgi:hypothetical protein
VPGDSDIGQLALLQRTLGAIDPADWPGAARLPDWGKVQFEPCAGAGLAAALPGAPGDALDLLAQMLRCARRGAGRRLARRAACLRAAGRLLGVDLGTESCPSTPPRRYPPRARPSAAAALAHPYFLNAPPPAAPAEVGAFAATALARHGRVAAALAALDAGGDAASSFGVGGGVALPAR